MLRVGVEALPKAALGVAGEAVELAVFLAGFAVDFGGGVLGRTTEQVDLEQREVADGDECTRQRWAGFQQSLDRFGFSGLAEQGRDERGEIDGERLVRGAQGGEIDFEQ